eukprot:1127277-Rhodomonas_salina.1
MFSAQKNAPQPPDPPPLSRVNSVGPTTANSPRDAPPGYGKPTNQGEKGGGELGGEEDGARGWRVTETERRET